jgi:hypothetical protein
MAIASVALFKLNIYEILAKSEELSKQIKQIYFSVAQNAEYPFLLINILEIQDLSKFDRPIYEVKFEICVYAKDKATVVLCAIADCVIDVLAKLHNFQTEYIISGMRASNLSFEQSQDLVSTKMSINFNALITLQ